MRRNGQTVRIQKEIPAHRMSLSVRCLFAVFSVLLVSSAVLFASRALAQTALGTWLNTDKKGKIVLWECGTEGLCSKIVWLKEPDDENGRPWRDILNPDPAKRSRPVMGVDVLEGLKKIGPNTWQGHIYDPEVGKRYYLKYIKIGADKVEIRGCLSTGWPCRTKYWTRTTPIIRQAPAVQVAAPRPAPKVKREVQPPPTLAQRAPHPAAPPVQRQASVQPPPPVSRPAVQPPASRPVAPRAPAQAGAQWQGQVAKAAPAPAPYPSTVTGSVPRPAAVAPPGAPGYLVQVTAGQDQGEALRAFGKLQQLYPNLLGGYLPNIQKVNLGPKGVWYRVRVGPMGRRTAAVGFCRQLKAVGADCMIRRQ